MCVSLSLCLSVSLSICVSVYLCLCLSVSICVCVSVSLSLSRSVSVYLCLSLFSLQHVWSFSNREAVEKVKAIVGIHVLLLNYPLAK